MRSVVLAVSVAGAMALAIACGGGESSGEVSEGDDAGAESPGSELGPATSDTPADLPPEGPAGTGLVSGLPCEVQAIVENRCATCHDGTRPGLPRLLTHADFMEPSLDDPAKTRAQVAAVRVGSATDPMPPPPAEAPSADEIAAFQAWVSAGAPKAGACTDPPPVDRPADAGTALDAGDAAAGATRCSSGKTWTGGDTGSPLMHPGRACSACHQQAGGPNLRFAGTVYPTVHEPNECIGSAPPPELTVVVTDSRGREVRMRVNASGNFLSRTRLMPPFRARVTDGTKTRAMRGTVTSGDCNGCHTEQGANGAPGRIMAP